MDRILFIRFSELTTKGKNRMTFVSKLFNNVISLFKGHIEKDKFIKKYDTIEVSLPKEVTSQIVDEKMKFLIGISYYAIGHWAKDLKDLEKKILVALKEGDYRSFKLIPKRRESTFFEHSEEFKMSFGKTILEKSGTKVDVKTPEASIYIEAYKDKIFFYINRKVGFLGLPYGSNGKALSLLSGGIDSPVASFKMMARGIAVDYVTFLTPPHTSQKAEDKIIKLVDFLQNYAQAPVRLFIVNFTPLLMELNHIKYESYKIILMRRAFMKISNLIAKKGKYDFLITGEALGQVSSQTPNSMKVINAASDLLVLRPLVGSDKNEIINLASKIGTLDISNMEGEDTCSLFLPKTITTSPILSKALELEKELPLLDDLAIKAIELARIYEVGRKIKTENGKETNK